VVHLRRKLRGVLVARVDIDRRLYRPIPRLSSTASRTSERIFYVLDTPMKFTFAFMP